MKKIIENAKFQNKLKQHKKLSVTLFNTQEAILIMPFQRTGKELALAYAECQCEHCKANKKLQYHHLIGRPIKQFMEFDKYRSQRYYWANILILCTNCHQEIEGKKPIDTPHTIPQITLDKIRKKYGIMEKQ